MFVSFYKYIILFIYEQCGKLFPGIYYKLLNSFASMAWFMLLMFLIPSPPCSFPLVTVSYFNRCTPVRPPNKTSNQLIYFIAHTFGKQGRLHNIDGDLGRGSKIGPTRWTSLVRLKLGSGWVIKLLARKKSGQI